MTESTSALKLKSHIGRDLLQSAALFKHEWQVAWEYVSNGLQYVDSNVSPIVTVNIDQGQKRMTIKDNGRGMSFADLENYFTMHGENIDAKAGRPGRGMFGTGKSAAFGIANLLRVTTIKNSKRSTVELRRADIEHPGSNETVPISVLESELPTDEPNGTVVEVREINLKIIDTNAITRELEKHIAFWKGVTVFVGTHQCEYVEPSVRAEREFRAAESPFAKQLVDVTLRVAVAKAPLAKEQQGISVISNGVLHESTLAGHDKRQFANYLFGTIDVPALAHDKSPMPPFDMSRSGRLNPKNELVRAIMAFVGMKLELVFQELEEEERLRKQKDETKRLQKEGDAIADLINRDFQQWKVQIQNVLAHTAGAKDYKPSIIADDEDSDILAGKGEVPASKLSDEGGASDVHVDDPNPNPNPDPEPDNSAPTFEADPSGAEEAGKRKMDAKHKSRGGGFSVDFKEMGEHEPRAKYEASERSILVNLEHPQLAAALKIDGIDDPAFRRLAYEVAFAEYSIALSVEMANDGHFMDPQDAITAVREGINRMALLAASTLYS